MLRRTKIIATIGPASNEPEVLRALLVAGVDVLRLNFSHASDDFPRLISTARQIAEQLNQPLAIMADLQGPKIRIGRFKNKSITLMNGESFTLNCHDVNTLGDEKGVSVAYTNLDKEIKAGDHLLLDDGLLELSVSAINSPLIECVVVEGGVLSDNKGINRKGGGLAARTLTEKDQRDMKTAVQYGVDYITLSFVKDAEDIKNARQMLGELGAHYLPIIAKIERTEAIDNLSTIIAESDAVMVARGDLGVEVGAAEVPALQKHIIGKARHLNKVVITATQMMESMISHPQPTRAEVSDVANAILDGTDAVMLSAETASGKFPVKVITMVDKICLSAEKHAALFYKVEDNSCDYEHSNHAIAMGAMHIANHFPIHAIVALTESGSTAVWMSRLPSAVPIYAITDNASTVAQLSMVNNVFPFFFDYRHLGPQDINAQVLHYLLEKNFVEKETYVLITRGQLIGKAGGTNSMEIVKV